MCQRRFHRFRCAESAARRRLIQAAWAVPYSAVRRTVELTGTHFRVRIASDLIPCIKKCRPEWNGIFDNAPEAIRTPDARLGKERFWDYRNFQPLCGFCVEISMFTAVACLWYLLVYFGKIRPQMKTFGQQKGCGCGSFIRAVIRFFFIRTIIHPSEENL